MWCGRSLSFLGDLSTIPTLCERNGNALFSNPLCTCVAGHLSYGSNTQGQATKLISLIRGREGLTYAAKNPCQNRIFFFRCLFVNPSFLGCTSVSSSFSREGRQGSRSDETLVAMTRKLGGRSAIHSFAQKQRRRGIFSLRSASSLHMR